MTNGGVQGPIEGYNSLDDLLTTTPTPGQAALLLPTAPTAAYTHPKWMEPYFDPSTPRNVTALMGKSAYLSCRVRNLANKTVSFDLKMHWSKSVQSYFEVLIKDQNTLLILRSKLFKIYKLYFFAKSILFSKWKAKLEQSLRSLIISLSVHLNLTDSDVGLSGLTANSCRKVCCRAWRQRVFVAIKVLGQLVFCLHARNNFYFFFMRPPLALISWPIA